MSDKDIIKDIFSEKLGNYEAKVNPELWNSIASQLGTVGATGGAATGLSLAAKWIIGVGIAGAITVTTLIITNNSEDSRAIPPATEETTITSNVNVASPTPNSEETTPPSPQQTDLAATHNNQTTVRLTHHTTNISVNQETNERVEEYVPILVPSAYNDRVVEQIIHRETVHTKDPVVNEPFMPEEVPAEAHVQTAETPQNAIQKDYYIDPLPNIFTPNGDHVNDRLKISSKNLTNFHVVVLNTQNMIVYESYDPRFEWDGTDQFGQKVPAGNYVYFITADEFSNDKPKRYSALLINY